MGDDMSKVGLVLEGGAMRGLYTAGVLDTMLDNKIKVDAIIGVSAGALFGCNYISKQKGRVLRYNLRYLNDPRYISIKSFIKTGNIIGTDFAYYELPQKLDIFDNKKFMKSKTKFYLTVTNVETGEAEYIRITDCVKQIEYFRATSAMPYLSKIVEIDEKKYLDGAIADSIPVKKCLEMGYDKVIVILTRPITYRRSKPNKILAKVGYKKYPKFKNAFNTRYIRYNKTVEDIIKMEENKEIIVIRPSINYPVKRLEKDLTKIQGIYDLGVKDCKNKMKELKKYLEV